MNQDMAKLIANAGFKVPNNQQKNNENNKKTNIGDKNNYRNNTTKNNSNGGYVGAPYNFVPISSKTYDYTSNGKKLVPHNELSDDKYSGRIKYKVVSRTPILLGGKRENNKIMFFKDSNGKYAIQGSSLRGLIKNNVQILGYSSFADDIDDYRLMYRDALAKREPYKSILGADTETINGKSQSVLKNVRAGYMRKIGDKYVIYGTIKDDVNYDQGMMNYYVLNERYMLENIKNYQYLYDPKSRITLQYSKNCKFEKIEKNNTIHYAPTANCKNEFNGRLNGPYKPFSKEVSYKTDGKRVISVGSKEDSKYALKGYLLGTGAMNEKKALYIVPQIDESKSFEVDENSIRAFEIDYNNRKNELGKDRADYYRLPKEGEIKPIFYIRYGGNTYFGYTPRLRLFYDYLIKDGYRQKDTELDYAKSLFGYATKTESYKGKVAFTNAYTNYKGDTKNMSFFQGTPKPTSYLDYLMQEKDKPTDYNASDLKIRGIKQYWNKQHVDNEPQTGNNENVVSIMNTLPEKTEFYGEVRFDNLTKDELGILLKSIEISDKAYQNIGCGKAYGLGSVKIHIEKLMIMNKRKAYSTDAFALEPMDDETENKEDFINEFRDTMAKWKNDTMVKGSVEQSFIAMKENIVKNELVRYMSIQNKEYQNRKNLPVKKAKLPTIKEILEKNM